MAEKRSESDHIALARERILDAALPHVRFDGWEGAFSVAVEESGVDSGLAALAFPRGAVDLALAFHYRGDALMVASVGDLSDMRYRDRVAFCIRKRLEIAEPHREAVRKGAAFLALPQHAADGAKAIWHTSDAIWTALGDTSRDINWYSKRATLSAVYSASVLFWLGDESDEFADTAAFIDRRIENVMQFEKTKAQFRESALGKAFTDGPGRLLNKIKAPEGPPDDLPGHVKR